jgi:transcriptional regulator with XRE-family HTH domain
MQLTWQIVDDWRIQRGMERAELARRAGIPERTIYSGLRNNSRLQAATTSVMRSVFPEKFNDKGEVLQ